MKYISKIFRPVIPVPKNATIKYQDANSKSQRLLAEFGVVKPTCSPGMFSFFPMGLRSLNKLTTLVQSKLASIDAQQLVLPNLTKESLWIKSGRLQTAGSELMRVKDRHNVYYILSPTHEEAITDIIASLSPISHKNLPLRLYQIGNKYRDEMRPRYGTIRSREFLMKDLYTFDVDIESAKTTYEMVNHLYEQIFGAIGVNFIKVEGHTGNMGGSISHEYHYPMPIGEDTILECKDCNYRITDELFMSYNKPACPKCGKEEFNKTLSLEVGHTFLLGTKYSKCLNALQLGNNPLQMGCYGLGLSRIIGAAVEVLCNERELRWPVLLAPYTICIIGPKKGSKEEPVAGPFVEEIYSMISKRCQGLENDVIIDDRSHMTIGKRVIEAKSFGFPYIIIVGSKATEEVPQFELIDVSNDGLTYFNLEALVQRVQSISETLKKMAEVNYMEHYCIPSDVLNETSLK